MSAWLAVAEIAVVLAAVAGMVLLKRHSDRQWADHLARQRVASSPAFRDVAKAFIQLKITLRDELTPSMQRAVAELSKFAAALDALPRLPWWRRAALRVRAWFA